MKLYVYRINDHEYGVGTSLPACEALGKIVEEWPLNTVADGVFLAQHGTNYFGASDKVSKLADLFTEVMRLDPGFAKADDVPIVPEPVKPAEPVPGLFTRIYHAFKNTDRRSR